MLSLVILSVTLLQASEAAVDADALVRQLADRSFADREQAQAALVKLGSAAEPALRKGATDADAQVRKVCQELLERLVKDKRAARWQAFLDDTDDRLNPPLPGWKHFAALAGKGQAERKRYLDLYRAAESTWNDLERDAKNAGKAFDARINLTLQYLLTPNTEVDVLRELTIMLVLANDPRVPVDAAASGRVCEVLAILAERGTVFKAFQSDAVSRKLARCFLVDRCAAASRVAGLSAAVGLELSETADWALRLAMGKDNAPMVRAWAAYVVGKVSGKEMAARLEPLLADRTSVGTIKLGNSVLKAELRDVVLAVLIRANGQKESEYGFPYLAAIPGLKQLPSPDRLGFADEASRESAFKKWEKRGRR